MNHETDMNRFNSMRLVGGRDSGSDGDGIILYRYMYGAECD